MKSLSKGEKGKIVLAPNNAERIGVSEFDLLSWELPASMSELKGKKILVVNTASLCGFTHQYKELQKLQDAYRDKLLVMAFPSNEFKAQEPGSDSDIQKFCELNYGITFPIASKTIVLPGEDQHPLYRWLCSSNNNGWNSQIPQWNFSKYLLDENRCLLAYFGPAISPFDKSVLRFLQ